MAVGEGRVTPSISMVGAVCKKSPEALTWQTIMCRTDKSSYVRCVVRSSAFATLLTFLAASLAISSAVLRS